MKSQGIITGKAFALGSVLIPKAYSFIVKSMREIHPEMHANAIVIVRDCQLRTNKRNR